MKKIKKVLFAVPALLALATGGLALTGCGNNAMEFTSASDIKTSVDNVVDGLVDNVYDKLTEGTYTLTDVEETLNKEINYYVLVGSLKNCDKVESIELGGVKFANDKDVAVSVGKNAQLKEKVYKYDDNKLYVAAPILAFETYANAKLKINDKEFTLKLNPSSDTFDFKNVKFINQSKNTSTKTQESNVWNVNLQNVENWNQLLLGLDYENAQESDVVLTRKYINNTLDGYGLTKVEKNSEHSLGLYVAKPVDSIDKVASKFVNANWDYKAYVRGQGIASAKFNVSVGTHVRTLEELKDALWTNAVDNSLVVLDNDIVLDNTYNETYPILIDDVKVTLDLNGHSIIAEEQDSLFNEQTFHALFMMWNANVTVTGNGCVDGSGADVFAFSLNGASGKLTIENGTYKGATHSVYVAEGEATILGGHYSVTSEEDNYEFTLNLLDANRANGTAKMIVKGGEFERFNPSDNRAEGEGTNFLAQGYKVVKNGDLYTVVPVETESE